MDIEEEKFDSCVSMTGL